MVELGPEGQGSLEAPGLGVVPCHAPGGPEARVGHREGQGSIPPSGPLCREVSTPQPPKQRLKWPSGRETDGSCLQGRGCTLFRGTTGRRTHRHTRTHEVVEEGGFWESLWFTLSLTHVTQTYITWLHKYKHGPHRHVHGCTFTGSAHTHAGVGSVHMYVRRFILSCTQQVTQHKRGGHSHMTVDTCAQWRAYTCHPCPSEHRHPH